METQARKGVTLWYIFKSYIPLRLCTEIDEKFRLGNRRESAGSAGNTRIATSHHLPAGKMKITWLSSRMKTSLSLNPNNSNPNPNPTPDTIKKIIM